MERGKNEPGGAMYPLRRRPGSRKGEREERMELDKNSATLEVTCHHSATAWETRPVSPSQRRTEAEHGRPHSISDSVAAIAVANDDLIEGVCMEVCDLLKTLRCGAKLFCRRTSIYTTCSNDCLWKGNEHVLIGSNDKKMEGTRRWLRAQKLIPAIWT